MRAYTDALPVATGTGGAGTFKLEWAARFSGGRQVVSIYDVDPAGKAGAAQATELLKQAGIDALRLVLPLSGDKCGFR